MTTLYNGMGQVIGTLTLHDGYNEYKLTAARPDKAYIIVDGKLVWVDFTNGLALPRQTNHRETVAQPPSTEMSVPNLPSLKAKKRRKLPRDKVLLEL
jgi:hypothetical protein